MTLQDWKSSGSYFNYINHQIFTKEEGEGEILVLIHGFPTSSWDWNKLWEPLTKKFKVITLDMIGFGFSDKPITYNYSILDQANLFETFLKHKNIETFHILSHDYGDTVVQELLARTITNAHSLTISSVCFLNGGMFPETNYPTFTQKLLLTPLGSLLKHIMGRHTLSKNFKKIFGKDTQASKLEIDEFWETIDYNNGKDVLPKTIKYLNERDQYKMRWREAIQQTISIPKLLINGGADPISGKHMADFYKLIIPNANVKILNDIGHYPQTEAPNKVLKLYMEFYNSL